MSWIVLGSGEGDKVRRGLFWPMTCGWAIYCTSFFFWAICKFAVDALANLSIIRPTSGAGETENSLIINELTEVSSEVVFRSSGSIAVKKVVDSGLKRCRIRLPLTSDRSESSV